MSNLGGRGLRHVWQATFILGAIMLNKPFIHIFDREIRVAGFPLIFIYLVGGWVISIAAIYYYRILIERSESGQEP